MHAYLEMACHVTHNLLGTDDESTSHMASSSGLSPLHQGSVHGTSTARVRGAVEITCQQNCRPLFGLGPPKKKVCEVGASLSRNVDILFYSRGSGSIPIHRSRPDSESRSFAVSYLRDLYSLALSSYLLDRSNASPFLCAFGVGL